MAFALRAKEIRCPNCSYEGKAEVRGTGCGLWLLFWIVVIISFTITPLLVIVPLIFLWLLLKPAEQVCPRCKYPHPIPK